MTVFLRRAFAADALYVLEQGNKVDVFAYIQLINDFVDTFQSDNAQQRKCEELGSVNKKKPLGPTTSEMISTFSTQLKAPQE